MLQVLSTYPAILKDITNRDQAPPALTLKIVKSDTTHQKIAESYESESTSDEGQLEQNTALDNALELKKNGSYEEAFNILQSLAAENNRQAQYELGEMYFHGHFVKQSYSRAMDYYLAAANFYIAAETVHDPRDSYKDAFNKIGYLYENGLGVSKDHGKAAEYYRQGAIGGNDDACCNLAYLYEHGFGVSTSNAAAIYWYARAGINF